MKSLRLLLVLAFFTLCTLSFAQSDSHKAMEKSASPAPLTDAQKSFALLKTVAGTWQGSFTVDPPQPGMGDGTQTQISMRVTSRGNAIVHEMKGLGDTDDFTKYDHPVTMFYLNEGQLLLTHYCDAGNRPRMVARASQDGKTVEFDFLDVAGGTQYGHMHHAVFTIVDANHHSEEWTYIMPGDKPVRAHVDLQRIN